MHDNTHTLVARERGNRGRMLPAVKAKKYKDNKMMKGTHKKNLSNYQQAASPSELDNTAYFIKGN
jgi:hypothetical protein